MGSEKPIGDPPPREKGVEGDFDPSHVTNLD